MCYKFWAGFAIGIRIVAIQFIRFAVPPFPFIILINFICCYIQKRADASTLPYCFQYIDRPHNICLISIYRIFVRFPYDRLCRQMKDDLRLCFFKHLYHMLQITNVSDHRMDLTFQICQREYWWICRWLLRISGHFRSQLLKYPAEPCPLKSGMSCHQNFLPFIKI